MRNMQCLFLLLLSGISGLASCASVTEDPGTGAGMGEPEGTQKCLFARTINNFEVLDDNQLIVWAPNRRSPYKIEIFGGCLNLRLANMIAFNTQGMLCGYAGERLLYEDMGQKRACVVGSVSQLSVQEMNTLLVKYGKKPSCVDEAEKATPECAGKEAAGSEENATTE
ncbi:MAG: DUF6491 family protein [Gammaproteobacteria bacterium]|nr:DUF6491 family protein [Gammaproteobacteria bacterium]